MQSRETTLWAEADRVLVATQNDVWQVAMFRDGKQIGTMDGPRFYPDQRELARAWARQEADANGRDAIVVEGNQIILDLLRRRDLKQN